MRIKEVAEKLGLSRLTVQRWIKQGRLKAHKVYDKWLIEEKDYRALIDSFEER